MALEVCYFSIQATHFCVLLISFLAFPSQTGWFPAKFVEILDERSKEVRKQSILRWLKLYLFTLNSLLGIFSIFLRNLSGSHFSITVFLHPHHLFIVIKQWFSSVYPQYSLAGDDSVTEAVTDLVRGTLCPALKAIFQHGLKKPSILGGPCHPWLFIEEVLNFFVIPTGVLLQVMMLVSSWQYLVHFLHWFSFRLPVEK